MNKKLLKEVLPDVANELELLLKKSNLVNLADQLPTLEVIDKCRCEDSFCSSIYTAKKPSGSWGPGHENITLDPEEGMIVLDVVDSKIVYIEILDRKDIRSAINKALP